MKRISLAIIIFILITTKIAAQDCGIDSKANDIVPDQLCSPVTANWVVKYRGVNDGGAPVQIHFDWDDGSTSIKDAINTDLATREWTVTTNHVYTSEDDICNYEPIATLPDFDSFIFSNL